jgi:hypothetical protein
MKNQVARLALVGTTALLMNVGWVMAADTTAQQPAMPGTASQTDTKSQENIPAGPDKQKMASQPSTTKRTHLKPAGTVAKQTMQQHAPDASKTPQEASVPAKTQP